MNDKEKNNFNHENRKTLLRVLPLVSIAPNVRSQNTKPPTTDFRMFKCIFMVVLTTEVGLLWVAVLWVKNNS